MMPMDEEKEKSGAALWVAVVLALIIYVLSPGPLMVLEKRGLIPAGGATEKVARVAMVPLRTAFFRWESVGKFYEWWFRFWGVN